MKNVLVANFVEKGGRTNKQGLELMLKAQIENSLEVGWQPEEICVVSNFEFEHAGIKSLTTELNKTCITGSKMFAIQWLMKQKTDDLYWAHDLDCWQSIAFTDMPKFKDVGVCQYSLPKFNGGSIFWRQSAQDIVDMVVDGINTKQSNKEEPILNDIFKTPEVQQRVTVLNCSYNLGCSGFRTRFVHAMKPIRVSHLHPTNRIAWEMHVLDRYQFGVVAMGERLEKLLRRFFPKLPTKLSDKDENNKERRLVPPKIRADENTKLTTWDAWQPRDKQKKSVYKGQNEVKPMM